MRLHRWSSSLCGLLLMLSGCLAGPATPSSPSVPAGTAAALPAGYDLSCPPGPRVQREGGLCVGTLGLASQSLNEPFLAMDPTDGRRMAVLAAAQPTRDAISVSGGRPSYTLSHLELFVSEDGGEQWTRIPRPDPNPNGTNRGCESDPALAFDPSGTLHVISLSFACQGRQVSGYGGQCCAFYQSTADLGKTWTPRQRLGDGADDRPWLTADATGRLWFQSNPRVQDLFLQWSDDGGTTWRSAKQPGCYGLNGPLVVDGDEVVAACQGGTIEDPTVRVLRFRPAAESWEEAATLHGFRAAYSGFGNALRTLGYPHAPFINPMITRTRDGTWFLGANSDNHVLLFMSQDGGRNWSEPIRLDMAAAIVKEWPAYLSVMWLEDDSHGAVHMLIYGSRFVTFDRGVVHQNAGIAYVALDPASMKPLASRIVVPTHRSTHASTLGDHFYGIAFAGANGMAVWVRDEGLDYAVIQPVR